VPVADQGRLRRPAVQALKRLFLVQVEREFESRRRKDVTSARSRRVRQLHRDVGAFEDVLGQGLQEPLDHPVEVPGVDRERGAQEILDTLADGSPSQFSSPL
jgi:hypothetical protein